MINIYNPNNYIREYIKYIYITKDIREYYDSEAITLLSLQEEIDIIIKYVIDELKTNTNFTTILKVLLADYYVDAKCTSNSYKENGIPYNKEKEDFINILETSNDLASFCNVFFQKYPNFLHNLILFQIVDKDLNNEDNLNKYYETIYNSEELKIINKILPTLLFDFLEKIPIEENPSLTKRLAEDIEDYYL